MLFEQNVVETHCYDNTSLNPVSMTFIYHNKNSAQQKLGGYHRKAIANNDDTKIRRMETDLSNNAPIRRFAMTDSP